MVYPSSPPRGCCALQPSHSGRVFKRNRRETTLTDAEWKLIEPLLPVPSPEGRSRTADQGTLRVEATLVRLSFAWLGRCRRLARDLMKLAICRFLMRRVAKSLSSGKYPEILSIYYSNRTLRAFGSHFAYRTHPSGGIKMISHHCQVYHVVHRWLMNEGGRKQSRRTSLSDLHPYPMSPSDRQ